LKDENSQSLTQSARIQLSVGIGLIIFLVMATVALDLLAHSKAFFEMILQARLGIDRQRKSRYSYEHYFVDFEDRLINEELPMADYSRGGVYLMGTSNLKWATRFWELPETERKLIHNYGIGATSHLFQFHFLRFLVEQQGLLAAGGEKNMVIFGVSWHAIGPEYSPQEFFPSLWERHGMYRYDVSTGITPVHRNELWRTIHFERVRIVGVVKSITAIVAHRMGFRNDVRQHDPAKYVRARAAGMNPNWKERTRDEMAQFEAMAKYLQSRRVKIVVVFLPQASWEDKMPFQGFYIDAMTKVCQRRSIQTIDWTKLLDDEDFADSNHFAPSGVDKLQPRFLEVAVPFLRSTGAL
jgi:hypothetical protein